MDVLKIINVRKRFGDKEVLKGLDLTVPEHSIFGFVGRNGSGKTTTMKALLGLLKIDDGEIYVCGERVIFGQTATNRHVGYLPDVPEFYSFMTGKEYLKLCGESLGMKDSEIEERSRELLELVGLAEENHRIKGYSRGMKQRLGIAQALLSRPTLLICDEPTSALDPIGRKEILDILLSVREQTTVLFSTHILSDVERICTSVALLHDGKIAMQGSVDELKKVRRADRFTVEVACAEDSAKIAAEFQNRKLCGKDTLLFEGGDDELFAVMEFINKNRISVRRIEREEPTLESLFLEVAGQ